MNFSIFHRFVKPCFSNTFYDAVDVLCTFVPGNKTICPIACNGVLFMTVLAQRKKSKLPLYEGENGRKLKKKPDYKFAGNLSIVCLINIKCVRLRLSLTTCTTKLCPQFDRYMKKKFATPRIKSCVHLPENSRIIRRRTIETRAGKYLKANQFFNVAPSSNIISNVIRRRHPSSHHVP